MKAADIVPEPVQEPVAAPIVEPTVEEVEEEEQQTAQEPEIQDASADEFDEEHEVELVFEREIPVAAVVIPAVIQEVKEVKEVKEEIIEEAVPAAVEVLEQAEEEPEQIQEPEQVHEVQEEAQADTPTTLVDDQLEHIKETEDTAQTVVETPRKTESWSAVSEDKVQTLQEVSRVARKLLFFDAIELHLMLPQSISASSSLTGATLLIIFLFLIL